MATLAGGASFGEDVGIRVVFGRAFLWGGRPHCSLLPLYNYGIDGSRRRIAIVLVAALRPPPKQRVRYETTVL